MLAEVGVAFIAEPLVLAVLAEAEVALR